MSRNVGTLFLILLWVCASSVLASAQAAPSPTETSSSSSSTPVAYIYVSSAVNSTTNQINGYSAAANGALTPIAGSPFPDNVGYMAVNGAWLLGNAHNEVAINSYSIAANGALTQKDTYPVSGGSVLAIWLDHTGSTLYADINDGDSNGLLALGIDQSSGFLTEVGELGEGPGDEGYYSFIGDNEYAYNSSVYEFSPVIYGAQRMSDGSLSLISNFSAPLPTPKSGEGYWPTRAAADPTNHVAIAVAPYKATSTGFQSAGPTQLATYTAQSDGSLTTSSTYDNMPKTEAGGDCNNTCYVTDYWMSPDGNYLAVGGTSGLQLFHFNGADPITKFTGLITRDPINQLFWDNNNHLYAISQSAGELFVWTVTSKGTVESPGSPYSITNPQNLIVLPK
jgi:6-phosphogluconolactonase (cycloisomerase 2 family)